MSTLSFFVNCIADNVVLASVRGKQLSKTFRFKGNAASMLADAKKGDIFAADITGAVVVKETYVDVPAFTLIPAPDGKMFVKGTPSGTKVDIGELVAGLSDYSTPAYEE